MRVVLWTALTDDRAGFFAQALNGHRGCGPRMTSKGIDGSSGKLTGLTIGIDISKDQPGAQRRAVCV
jgi:hypothetical protein